MKAVAAVNDGLNRFAGEIDLLGLGVDLSLSQKNAGAAEDYMADVPSRPQWQFREAQEPGCRLLT